MPELDMTDFEDHLARAVRAVGEMLAQRTRGLETACVTEDGESAPIGAVELSMDIETARGMYRVSARIATVDDERTTDGGLDT